MVLSRALLGTTLGTALGLGLAGCAMENAATAPQTYVAGVNRTAAASVSPFSSLQPAGGPGVQVASIESSVSDASSPVIQKGTVLWRRAGEESERPAAPPVGEELQRLRETLSKVQGETAQQLAELQNRLQTSQQALAQVQSQQAQQQQELRAQTVAAVSNVASMAQESMRSMERVAMSNTDNWKSTTQQLTQLEGRLQTALADVQQQQAKSDAKTQSYTDLKVSKSQLESQIAAVREARQAALDTEQRTKAYMGEQLATRDVRLGELSSSRTADRKLTELQLAQLAKANENERRITDMQLAELRKLNIESRALASSEVSNVAAALRQYADAQFQQAAATTSATLVSMAQATDQSISDLSNQTNRRLGVMWQAANQNAEKLAEQKANAVAASLAALQQQTAADRISPDQIRSISEQTVANATPEFRALALRTMQDSQDYIRTVARNAVQDKDPGMTTALADAARDVITKDDRVVFAIRKAVADELEGAMTGTTAATGDATKLGPDRNASVSGEANLDPNRLRIAQLLAPGSNLPAPDAVQLANLSPASGPAPQTEGPQSWSVPGTSLMRSRNRSDWMDIRQYKVVVHEDDQTLEQLLGKIVKHAEPFTGPWQLRWKVSDQNRDILTEKFSLDAETTFEEFVSYLAQYVVNDRGVKLSFSLFDNERIIVISD